MRQNQYKPLWTLVQTIRVGLGLCVFALCTGCGYRFVEPGAAFVPNDSKNVAVVELENRTPEVQLGSWCSRSLQQQLQSGDRALVAPDEADFVVQGVVLHTTDDPRAFALTPSGDRAEAQVSVHVELIALQHGRESFRQRAIGRSRYTASGFALSVDAERRQALRLACADALSGLLESLAEVWTSPRPPNPSSPQTTASHQTR